MLENDNTVLIKGLKKVVNVKFSRNMYASYRKRPMIGLKSREITFQQYRENLLSARVFRWLQISMNIKDITILTLITYLLESIQVTTNLSTQS